MDKKKIILIAFIAMALVQIYVPAKMIMDRELILKEGKSFLFKAAPIDPNDPFRGKYITLSYEINRIKVDPKDWVSGEPVYLLLATDAEDFANVLSVSKSPPADTADYLLTTVDYLSSDELVVDLPFDRFYMEESKAPGAERVYSQSLLDASKVTYALVKIRDGQAVLADVLIDGIPIREVVKAENL